MLDAGGSPRAASTTELDRPNLTARELRHNNDQCRIALDGREAHLRDAAASPLAAPLASGHEGPGGQLEVCERYARLASLSKGSHQ